MRPVFLLFAVLLGLSAARAQSLEEIDRRQAALIEAWEKTPLTIRRALFINGGFVVDFHIKSRDGEVLAEKENFMRIATESHTRNLEFMVVLTLNLTSAPPGDYVVEYKLHDIASDKTASFNMPFKIAS